MLETAPKDEDAFHWARIPTDGKWYILGQPAHRPINAPTRLGRWPYLEGGHKHWKHNMTESAGRVCALLRHFDVEPFCTLCDQKAGGFAEHTTGLAHYQTMINLVDMSDDVVNEEQVWHETHVVGGRVRYNELSGQLLAWRDEPLLLETATSPQELSVPGQWILVGAAVAVPSRPAGDMKTWPNLWSKSGWKRIMQTAVKRVVDMIKANVTTFDGECRFCPGQHFCENHLLGPKHLNNLRAAITEDMPVKTGDFNQRWVVWGASGELRYNHIDGTLQLQRYPAGPEHRLRNYVGGSVHSSGTGLPTHPPPPSVEEKPVNFSSHP
jgi:hypothetical protein